MSRSRSALRPQIGAATAAEATADGQGRFVAQFTLPASPSPRVLSLSETASDGKVSDAEANVIVAPSSAEAVTATATATGQSSTEAPAVLMAGQEGVKVLQPSAAAPMAIDTIAYSTAGEVELTGHGTPGETLRIHLDNHLAQQVALHQKGSWRLRLPDIASGVYTLRADQVHSTGKVTAQFETPFKREAPEALAEAGGGAGGAAAGLYALGDRAGELWAWPALCPGL